MKKSALTLYYLTTILVCFCTVSFCHASEVNRTPQSTSTLQKMYENHCNTPSDINEHIPVLRQLASECSSAIEIGVRSIVSTWGILQGLSENPVQPKWFLGIDLAYPPLEKLQLAKQIAEENHIDFLFWPINDMEIDIEPVDMLFIDSLHTYCHLTYELESFSPKVRKYICMHDTSAPWGHQDDAEYCGNYAEYPDSYDRTKKGLWPAVEDFLARHPEWSLYERRTNNHGFTILKRNDESAVTQNLYHPDVEYFLKNKVVLCTGPSLYRYDLLKNKTEADMNLIPFKKIFVTTNDPRIMDITFNGKKPVCQLIENRGKQLDCLNCIITTLRNAANDPEVEDDDIIMFKHESVYLNDRGLIKKAMSKILEGYDMVARSWMVPKSRTRGTDAFFVRMGAIREIVKDYPLVTGFTADGTFCEEYFTTYLVSRLANVYDVPYCHSNGGFTELGFYHITSTAEAGRAPWDRSNYRDLFKQ
jgi:hypothetical protein